MEAIRNPLTPSPPLPGSACDEKVLCQMVLFSGIVQWVDIYIKMKQLHPKTL